MTRDRVACQVTVSTPVYPVYRCMLLGQVSRRRRNGCSGLTEIAGVGLDNDGIVDSEFKQQKTATCDRPLRRCVNLLRRRRLRNALFDALRQLSGTHYRKLFSVVTLLQFLSLG